MPPMPLHRPRRLRAASERFADDEHRSERGDVASRWDVRGTGRGPARRPERARRVTVPHFRIKSYRLSPVSFYRLSIGRNGHSLSSAHGLIGRGPARRCGPIVQYAIDRSSRDLRSHDATVRDPTIIPILDPFPPLSRARLRLRVLAKHGPRSRLLDTLRYDLCSIRRTPRADRWTVRALCRVGLLVPTIMFGGAQREAP